MVYIYTTTNLLSSLCTFYKPNILLLYYIILLALKFSITFSVLCDYVTCDYDICDHSITGITFLLCFVIYATVMYNITTYSFI